MRCPSMKIRSTWLRGGEWIQCELQDGHDEQHKRTFETTSTSWVYWTDQEADDPSTSKSS